MKIKQSTTRPRCFQMKNLLLDWIFIDWTFIYFLIYFYGPSRFGWFFALNQHAVGNFQIIKKYRPLKIARHISLPFVTLNSPMT